MANTKLTAAQKLRHTGLKTNFKWQGGRIFHFESVGVCVGIRRTGKEMAEFSVSIQSPKETKYKKKVAEFYMLGREPMPCRVDAENTFFNADTNILENTAASIAFSVSKG